MNAQAQEVEQVAQKQVAPWVDAMQRAQPKFEALAEIHHAVTWKAEANYARQSIQNNKYLQSCSPQSLVDAVINVAAIGLSLSPAEKLAYLVPRGNVCSLDISYMGLIRLATDTGACEYIRADLVRENDVFEYNGPAERARFSTAHAFSPEKRGAIVGVYAEAMLPSGRYLTEIMSMDDITAVKNTSRAKSGPWVDFFGEMARKTVIKRLAKTIPRTKQSNRLDTAIHVLNEHEGMAETPEPIEHRQPYTPEQKQAFDTAMSDGNEAELWHLSRSLPTNTWLDLHGSYLDTAPKGKKGEYRKRIDGLTSAGRETFASAATELSRLRDAGDEMGATEILAEFDGQHDTLNEQIDDPELFEWLESLMEQEA